jgi:pimeloyl-ACP methyl ester carboxylesterase
MADVTVGDVRLTYEEHGSGDPLVLVCGLGQPAASWPFSILPGLVAAGFKVVTFDNRGVAPSESPPAPYTIAQMADDTAGLIEHLGIAPCVVAGYSLGAWIAETLAADRPELLRAAVCIAGLNQTTEWEKVECEYGRDLAALDVPLPRLQPVIDLLPYPPRALLQDDEEVGALVERYGDDPPWGNPGRLGQWEAAFAWTRDDGAVARWERISVPCLSVTFENDIDCPPRHARIAASHVSGGRFIEIPDATHLGPFEQPDAVVSALVHFLTSLDARAP